MARTVLVLNNPKFKIADTLVGLSSGVAYECQLTSATITANPQLNTIPATGCAPSTQSPGKTQWQLDLAWLQDWAASGGGLSGFSFTNDTLPKFFELTLDTVGAPTVKAVGQAYVVAGSFGGTFGDGSPAAASSTWPLLDKPTITMPVLFEADVTEEAVETTPETTDEPVTA